VSGAALAAVCLLWSIPTLGVLISSVRPEAEVKGSGW
jgi:alpha-glucoside transport system permease protein